MDYLTHLNEKQRQAATALKEPVLVLAGPGTGKTRTLVARILYLIRSYHIPPHKIMAVTFTNKAKEEMCHRLTEELGDTANDLMIGTFHHYCLDVLRSHHHEAGLPKQFAIADEITQLMTLSRASRMLDERSLRTILNAISSYRLNSENLNPTFQGAALKWLEPYHEQLRKNKLIDFDQIMLLTQKLFAEHPELIEHHQQRFEAILVDEFQDTDPIQYEIMRTLAQQHRNIFAVADDDQSIFAWRGANIGNINRYIKDFDCQENVIILDENYRSAQCIIDLATQLLQHHRFIRKEIHASTDSKGIPLRPEHQFLCFPDDEEETQFITEQIRELTHPEDHKNDKETVTPLRYNDIAVLYPNHAIGEQLEAQLLASRIPCQLVKRQGIFDQEDVKKIILLLKLLQNPEDDITLEQYFELELNNDLIFQQIKSFKSKSRSFKQMLNYIRRTQTLAGISRGEFYRLVDSCFGTISNMISYVESNPQATLEDLISTICNQTKTAHSFSIHSNIHKLCDPCNIPGIPEAVAKIREAIAHERQLYITGTNSDITRICHFLLNNGLNSKKQNAHTGQQFEILPSDFQGSLPESALILCLSRQSAAMLLSTSSGNISETQLIVITKLLSEKAQVEQSSKRSSSAYDITSPFTSAVTIFKLLQALSTIDTPKAFRNYVVVDLETTSGDTRTTGIVEIGAVKVRDGKIVSEFGTLVNPEQPITQGAYKVHGISDDDVRDKKTFQQLLPEFLEFIGDDMLVAHNGFGFDFPILIRLYKKITGKMLPNRRFDTLPLARRLFPGQRASVDALMQRFHIKDTGNRHRALDDTIFLAPIFERLQEVEQSLNRRSEHEEVLELVALGVFLESPQCQEISTQQPETDTEEMLLFQLGVRKLLSRFSELPEQFQPVFAQAKDEIEEVFHKLSSSEVDKEEHIIQDFNGRDISIARLKELAKTFPAPHLRDAIRQFLDHATLYTSQDDICEVNAVNLLTIHSAKGLEFPVVFVSGVEKGNLPSFYSVREEGELREKKLDEQRRLFYVAMTRAKHKLFVTYVNKRGEYPKKRSQFLIELGIESKEEVGFFKDE